MDEMRDFLDLLTEGLKKSLQDCTFEVQKVPKNNGVKCTAICIREENSHCAPVVYVDEYYEDYKNGVPVSEIVKDIIDSCKRSNPPKDLDLKFVFDYKMIYNIICFKIINREANAELLQSIPYREYKDFAIIYYLRIDEVKGNITVSNDMMKCWGIDENRLYRLAKINTPQLLRGMIEPFTDILESVMNPLYSSQSMGFKHIESTCCDMNFAGKEELMYVVSNHLKKHGAGVLLYDDVLKDFAENIQSSFYILPSSIHELLFLPAYNNDLEPAKLLEMVKEVNQTNVAEADVLSNNVYFYDKEKQTMEIIVCTTNTI